MRTILDLPDELLRRAKDEAVLRARTVEDMIEEGLRLVLAAPYRERDRPSLEELMKEACGVVDSGAPDRACNPKYLNDFGREK